MSTTTFIPKVTLKSCGAQPAPHSIKERTALMRVYGSAQKGTVGTSNYGDFIKFAGAFEAINLRTGEIFRANILILPSAAEAVLQAELANAKDEAVEFAFEIVAMPSEKGNTGYSFAISPMHEPTRADPLRAMREKFALPAPQAELLPPQAEPKLETPEHTPITDKKDKKAK